MKKLVLALCSVSSLAIAAPAFGQAANDSTTASSDTIIVTARRREESAQDVPLVVNTVSSEAVGKLNLQNFTEVQTLVPGLLLKNTDSGIGANAQIRGVQFDINASARPTVEFYLNDAVITSDAVLQQMFDISQIEVLRGPQGTLRGRSSPSGSITITTRKPDLYEAGGNVSATGNNIGGLNFNGGIGVPIIEGVAAIRVAGVYNENEFNRVRTINRTLDGRDAYTRTKGGRVSLLIKPANWLQLEGSYHRLERSAAFYNQYASASLFDPAAPASTLLIRPADRLSIGEIRDTNSQTYDIFNWRAEVNFAGQALIYQGAHSKSDLLSNGTSDPANRFAGTDFPGETHTRAKGTSHELRLQNVERVMGMFDYVIGVFRSNSGANTNLISVTPIALPSFLGGGLVATNNTYIVPGTPFVKETSFFGNVTAHIGEKTQISAGLRQIQIKQDASNLSLDFGSGTPTVLPTSAAVNDKKLIYTASIQHAFTPDLMVYASTGTSRRSGPTIVGIFSPVQSALQRQFTVMPSEDSTSYEVGIKSTWLDGRLIMNLTAYHQKFKNYPYKLTSDVFYTNYNFDFSTFQFIPAVGNSAQYAAPVPVLVKGIEAELSYKASDNFNFSLVAAYADGKVKNGLIPCNDLNRDGVPDATTGAPTVAQLQAAYGANNIGSCTVTQRAAYQAPFSAAVQAEYSHPVSDKVSAFTRGQFSYYGGSQNDPTNTFDDIGAYGLLNLFAGVRDPEGNWEVSLFAKNLFNTTKVLSYAPAVTGFQELTFSNPATVGQSFTSPYSRISTTPPREFGLNVRFAFGSR